MRINSGAQKGARIRAKVGSGTRPTTAKVRKAIFDTLFSKFDLRDAEVLDLFAGTGSLGFEAASRGAASVTFVESDRRAAEGIRGAAEGLKGRTPCKFNVVNQDALGYLARRNAPADLCLCDPPYEFDRWDELMAARPAGFLVAESNRELSESGGYVRTTLKKYGDTVVSFFSLRGAVPEATQPERD